MGASGRDIIVIETVGAGQSEVEIVEVADVCVVVNAPHFGEDIQAIQVVNKADQPLASRTADHLRAMLALWVEQRDVPVIETVATSGTGVEALAAAMDARAGRSATQKRASRLRRVRRLIAQTAGRQIRDRILTLDAHQSDERVQAALDGRCGIANAAGGFLRLLV